MVPAGRTLATGGRQGIESTQKKRPPSGGVALRGASGTSIKSVVARPVRRWARRREACWVLAEAVGSWSRKDAANGEQVPEYDVE